MTIHTFALTLVVVVLATARGALPQLRDEKDANRSDEMDRVLSGSFRPPVPPSLSRMALVSWNIERGQHAPEMLKAFRGPLAADLYLLQEVDIDARRTGNRNLAEEMARALGMDYVFGVEFLELSQGPDALHGQAILSRCPIAQTRILRFRHQSHNWGPRMHLYWTWLQPRAGGRMALVTEIRCQAETWAVYNTHLESWGTDASRARQMREIIDDIRAHYPPGIPVIVAGDFNTRGGRRSPVVRELKSAGFHDVLENHPGPLATKPNSGQRKDWIFVRDLQSFHAAVPRVELSDHYPVVTLIGASPSR